MLSFVNIVLKLETTNNCATLCWLQQGQGARRWEFLNLKRTILLPFKGVLIFKCIYLSSIVYWYINFLKSYSILVMVLHKIQTEILWNGQSWG